MSVAFNPYFKLKLIDLSTSATVASGGGSDTIALQPNSGYIYQVINCIIVVPAVGTANTHLIEIRTGLGTSGNYDQLYAKSTFAAEINIGRYGTVTANDTELPSGDAAQQNIILGGLWGNYDYPIDIKYTNSTDVNQTGTRTYIFLVKEYKEG